MRNILTGFFGIIALIAFISVFGIAGAMENDVLTFTTALKMVFIAFAVMFASGAIAAKLDDAEGNV